MFPDEQAQGALNAPTGDAHTRSSTVYRAAKSLRSNRGFFTYLVVSHLLFLGLSLWPFISDNVEDWAAHDGAPATRKSKVKPLFRNNLFRLSVAGAVGGIACYGLCFRERRFRILRALALAGITSYQCSQVVANHRAIHEHFMNEEKQWSNTEQLKIIDCENAHVNAFQIREEIRSRGITRFSEFHHCVLEQYFEAEPRLKQGWAAIAQGDAQKMRALFIMNFVAGLWSFGNPTAVDEPGCVFDNENNEGQTLEESLAPYLESQIGCCTDFAYLTKSLLDHEGLENRLTAIPGHIFNEVKIGERWCILDATVNLFVDCSWEELYEREWGRDSVTVLVFPNPNLADAKSTRYRSIAGHFRVIALSRLANRPPHLRKTEHPELPGYFQQDR